MLDLLFLQSDGWDAWRLLSAALSVSASVVYLGFADRSYSLQRALLKTSVIAVLAPLPLSFLTAAPEYATTLVLLSVALGLSALGDLFLALEDQKKYFVPGLGSFLLAHVAFVISFLPLASVPGASAAGLLVITAVLAGYLILQILPNLGALKLPVLAYFAVIMLMVAVAFSVRETGLVLGLGAALFAFSDSMIAVRKFLRPFKGINETIWISYVIAQYVMTATVIWVALATTR